MSWFDNFEFDEKSAKAADNVADRMSSSGLYVGTFTRVNAVQSEKGTHGLNFDFQLLAGGGRQSATLWTEKEDGTRIFGANLVQSVMTLLKVKKLKGVPGKVEQWEEGKKVEKDGTVFPDLMNKPIGVLWQRELLDGDKFRYNIYGFCDANSKLMASEVLEGTTKPEKLEKALKGLKDKDSRKNKVNTKPDVFGEGETGSVFGG